MEERREIPKGVVEMVCHIPSRVTGAEALLRVARGSGKMQCRTEAQGRVRVVQAEIREERAHANSRDCAGIILLDGSRGARKIKRHAHINTKVTRKVIADGGPNILDRAIAAVPSFELVSQLQSRSQASVI